MSATFWNIRRRLRQKQIDKEAATEAKVMEQEIDGRPNYIKPDEGLNSSTEQHNSSGEDD